MSKTRKVLMTLVVSFLAISVLQIIIEGIDSYNSLGKLLINFKAIPGLIWMLFPNIILAVYIFAFYKNEKARMILLACLALPLLDLVYDAIGNTVGILRYIVRGAIMDVLRSFFLFFLWVMLLAGVAFFTLLILYMFKAIRNKKIVSIYSLVYLGLVLFFRGGLVVREIVMSIPYFAFDGFTVRFLASYLLSFANIIIYCLMWWLFSKDAILSE